MAKARALLGLALLMAVAWSHVDAALPLTITLDKIYYDMKEEHVDMERGFWAVSQDKVAVTTGLTTGLVETTLGPET